MMQARAFDGAIVLSQEGRRIGLTRATRPDATASTSELGELAALEALHWDRARTCTSALQVLLSWADVWTAT